MRVKAGLDESQLESRPLEVAVYLRGILGDLGYSFVEKLMVHEISVAFDVNLKKGISFEEAVYEARKKFFAG